MMTRYALHWVGWGCERVELVAVAAQRGVFPVVACLQQRGYFPG